MIGMLKEHSGLFLIIVLIIFAAVILSIGINFPFASDHEGWNAGFYSNVARNHLTLGFSKTLFGNLQSVEPAVITPKDFSVDHPPLLGLLLYLSFALLGNKESSARMVPILFSIGSLILMYFFLLRFYAKKIAFISCVVMILMPIFAYYGHMAGHESIIIFSVIGVFYFYFLWVDTLKQKYLYTMLAFFVLGALTSWPAYFVVFPIIFHAFLWNKSEIVQKRILSLPFTAAAAFTVFFIHAKLLTEKPFFLQCRFLKNALWFRTGIMSKNNPYYFTFIEFVNKEKNYFMELFGFLIIPFLAVWVAQLLGKIFLNRDLHAADKINILLWFYGLAPLFLLSCSAYYHDYYLFYLLPAVIFSVAWSLYFLKSIFSKRIFNIISISLIVIFFCNYCFFIYERFHSKNYIEYELWSLINKSTGEGEIIFTNMPSSNYLMNYYADRYMVFDVINYYKLENLLPGHANNGFNFLLSKDFPADGNLLNFLEKDCLKKNCLTKIKCNYGCIFYKGNTICGCYRALGSCK